MNDGDSIGEVSEDCLLGGRVRLRQPASGYRVAIDPVLLAAAIQAQAGARVLDMGAGAGAAALCLAARCPGVLVVGLEIAPGMVALARHNAEANGLADRVHFIAGDVLAPPSELAPESFNQVMINPPFSPAGRGNPPPDAAKMRAAVEGAAGLDAWIRLARRLLKRKGTLSLIHRADRLDALMAALADGFGGIVIHPLWPGPSLPDGRGGKEAKRILVQARKGLRTPLRLTGGLVLHDSWGRYTPAAQAVLREGAALTI